MENKHGFSFIGIIIVIAVVAILGGGGIYIKTLQLERSDHQLNNSGTANKKEEPQVNAEAPENMIVTKATLDETLKAKGISEIDINTSLQAGEEFRSFCTNRAMPSLTPAQEEQLKKQVNSIIATKKALSGSADIVIDSQPPGKTITINSVLLKEKGFVVIKKNADFDAIKAHLDIIGVSSVLSAGTEENVEISLNEYVDGVELKAYLYKDNGDGIFNPDIDKYATRDDGWAIYKNFGVKTNRNLSCAFYSIGISKGSPTLVITEQLPGNSVDFSSISIPDLTFKKKYFIGVYKDSGGLPNGLIGNIKYPSRLFTSSENNEKLTAAVSNEMLYAIIFEDDGDGKFNPVSDHLLRGENGLIIIVKFKVISINQ